MSRGTRGHHSTKKLCFRMKIYVRDNQVKWYDVEGKDDSFARTVNIINERVDSMQHKQRFVMFILENIIGTMATKKQGKVWSIALIA